MSDVDLNDYSFCPVCGEIWEEHNFDETGVQQLCKPEILIEKERPHFYIMDLDHYVSDFLIEIIQWQNKKIEMLENKLKPNIPDFIEEGPSDNANSKT
jgi:hypothetical protein